MILRVALSAMVAAAVLPAGAASAQFVQKPTVSGDAAKTMVAACEAMARQNGWKMVIAVVDDAGNLVNLHRMDGSPLRSIEYAQRKAKTAVLQQAPSKVVADRLAGGQSMLLATPLFPIQGGLPIMSGNVVAGAIGASGGTSQQDEDCVQAGINAAVKGAPAAR